MRYDHELANRSRLAIELNKINVLSGRRLTPDEFERVLDHMSGREEKKQSVVEKVRLKRKRFELTGHYR